ncbi:MAG: cyclic pyranopterin monophosphate synthase MoaC [Cyanobacteria bacterium]|nr:cyclic pyranopterin monophosphate synthase MoaC [Cyanobacteriota bacterium]
MQSISENSPVNLTDSAPTALTHLDSDGQAQMVDVSAKPITAREAVAQGEVWMAVETLEAILAGNSPKGDVLGTARLAGIMGAKQTSALIPLCHPLPIHKVDVQIVPDIELPGFRITATVRVKGETGVEMEALTAVSVAALTLYDMAKALDKNMEIRQIVLLKKTGGKSGDYVRSVSNSEYKKMMC